MSAVVKQMVAPKYIQIRKEASIVNVTLDFYYAIKLLVMVNIT